MLPSDIRVLIANLPDFVAEMVRQTIQQQSDITWLGNVNGWEDIVATIDQTDILILGVDDVSSLPEPCFHFLGNHPQLKILLITLTGDEAIVYWRPLHCQPIQIMSAQTLVESIRHIHSLLYEDMRQHSSFLERN